jgi:hypothetical protein
MIGEENMQITLSKLSVGLLAGVSIAALSAGSAQARSSLLEVHGYMDHGKLVAVKVIEHKLGVNPKKIPTYTYDYTLSYSATITTPVVATAVVGWGLYDPDTCMGVTAGKMKKPTTTSLYGKWGTSVTAVTGATTKYCPGGITNFNTANATFDVKKKAPSGAVITGTSVWTAKATTQVCPVAPSCIDKYTIDDPLTVTYSP